MLSNSWVTRYEYRVESLKTPLCLGRALTSLTNQYFGCSQKQDHVKCIKNASIFYHVHRVTEALDMKTLSHLAASETFKCVLKGIETHACVQLVFYFPGMKLTQQFSPHRSCMLKHFALVSISCPDNQHFYCLLCPAGLLRHGQPSLWQRSIQKERLIISTSGV